MEPEKSVEAQEKTDRVQEDHGEPVQPEIVAWSATSGGQKVKSPKQKKIILFGVLAGIFLLIIAGAYLGYIFLFKKKHAPLKLSHAPAPRSEVTPETAPEPLIYLNANLALLRKFTESYMPAENKDLGHRIATAIYDALRPEQGHVFLYPDPEYQFLPVLLVHFPKQVGLKDALIKKGVLAQFMEPSTAGSYRIKSGGAVRKHKSDFPIDIYRVWLFEKSAVFGPVRLSHLWSGGEKALLSSAIVKFAESVRKPASLAAMSFHTGDIQDGWEKSITDPLSQNPDPQVAQIAAMAGSALSTLTQPFRQINSLAIGFQIGPQKKRILSYVQEFRRDVDGDRIYQQLKTGVWEDMETGDFVLNLVELLNDRRLDSTVDFESNRLSIDLTWSQEEDESILHSLADATIGYLFERSIVNDKPTEGSIPARYATTPKLISRVNAPPPKSKIRQAVKNSLFPNHFWQLGNNPRMKLDLDPLDLPNAALAELHYEILSIGLPGDKNVLRKGDKTLKRLIGTTITLPVLKGTRPEELGNVNLRFNIVVPLKMQIFKFQSNGATGRREKAEGVSVTVTQFKKDVARVSYRRGISCHLFAFDSTGQALAGVESMGSSSSVFSRFQGIIDTLEVVVVTEVLEHTFEVEVDLNNGKELELPAKPEASAPVRHDRQPVLTYADLSRQDLQGISVQWDRDKNLSLALPKNPVYGNAEWEVHFFDKNKPVLYNWDPSEIGGKYVVYFRKPLSEIPDAAFGSVRLTISTGIQRLSFSKKSGNGRTVKRLPGGQKVMVNFAHNQITYNAGNKGVLQVAAYDAGGKRLRRGKYAGRDKSGQVRRFWGQPATLVLDIATQQIQETIPFDLQTSPIDSAAFASYKRQIDRQRDVFKVLKTIGKARAAYHSSVGETLAGLYFIHRKKQQPLMLIDKSVAHSDPAGQSRYGYKLKPYRGYYFTYLAGTEENGIKTDYQRQPQEKTFTWQKGSFKAKPYYQLPDVAALPVDNLLPTFILRWDEVYVKYLQDQKLKYGPQHIYNSDWTKVYFLSK
jgi:hypothetical protein